MDLAELFSQYQNLELVLESLPEAIIVHDMERRITFFNPAAERLTGLSAKEVIGGDCRVVFEGGICGSRCSFCEGCAPMDDTLEYPLVITHRDGTRHRVEMTIVPMRDHQGAEVGVLAAARDVTEIHELRQVMGRERSFRGIIGKHHRMQQMYGLIREVAQTEVPVLVQGESGTGKELVAAAIHSESSRAGRPFVAVNCGALPEGLLESELFGHVRGAFTGAVKDKKGRFELADGGTLFLDEIGEVSQAMQVKLLRVLESSQFERVGGERTQSVDVRVISATNRDLKELVLKGGFRQDLYFRLCVVPIVVPPLRERRADILALADHFLERFAADAGREAPVLAESAVQPLLEYRWPGNVRELQNALQFALVKTRGDVVEERHLPSELRSQSGASVHRAGRKPKLTPEDVRQALDDAGGNRAKAARRLGVGRSTLYRYLSQMD